MDDLTFRPSKIIRTELHKFADKLIGSGDVRSIAQSLSLYGFDNEIRL